MNLGKQIVVVEAGFVYVGECTWKGDFLRIDSAKNIRIWGTTKGLGELRSGPASKTQADFCGVCLIPRNKVVLFLDVEGGW